MTNGAKEETLPLSEIKKQEVGGGSFTRKEGRVGKRGNKPTRAGT